MRKLYIFLFTVLLVFGFTVQARAEISASGYSGNRYEEQQVFVYAYNNSGSSVTSNSVVIFQTTIGSTNAEEGTTLGSYFTTTTSAGSPYIFGVTDETIADGASGRICVRGPHKIDIASNDTAAGDTISTSTSAGQGETQTTTTNKYGYVGIALAQSDDTGDGLDIWWCWVNPTVQ